MGDRIRNQKNREYTDAKQNYKAYGDRGGIGDRSSNLTELIGVERVSQRNYEYEETYYEIYEPVVRRIVMIKMREYQLSLNL